MLDTVSNKPLHIMVLLHVKRSETDQFLYETTVEKPVAEVLEDLVVINNLRHRIHRLRLEGEELAKYGPAKHPDKQGIDTYAEGPVDKGPHYLMDPSGRRTGNACDPEVSKVLLRCLEEADAKASKDNVLRKVAMSKTVLLDAIREVKGAVMICYPMGLPEWDLVRQCLDDTEDLAGTSYAADVFEMQKAVLWFAGKECLPSNKLKDHVGRNERTKAIVKLQRKGQGPPAREAPVDAETQKAMISYYHKKQEEQKRLQDDEDDLNMDAPWARSTMKTHFSGIRDVRIPR